MKRNIPAHDYDNVMFDLVWDSIIEDFHYM